MSEKKKMGRPRQHEEAKREPIAFRVTPTMKDEITRAAEASGRSIAQEIEGRLEMSFFEDRVLGGRDTALLTKLIASTVKMVELETGRSWTEDRMTFEAAKVGIQRILTRHQPHLDFDIWDRHRDLMLHFLQSVIRLDATKREIEGLQKAYSPEDMPDDVKAHYERALRDYPEQLAKVRREARAVFEGPMKEQQERIKESVRLGAKIAGQWRGEKVGNFILGGVVRMYASSGAFEPLPGLRDAADISDDELFACIRKLAGAPPDDPDMEVFRMKRTYEDFAGDEDAEQPSGSPLERNDDSRSA